MIKVIKKKIATFLITLIMLLGLGMPLLSKSVKAFSLMSNDKWATYYLTPTLDPTGHAVRTQVIEDKHNHAGDNLKAYLEWTNSKINFDATNYGNSSGHISMGSLLNSFNKDSNGTGQESNSAYDGQWKDAFATWIKQQSFSKDSGMNYLAFSFPGNPNKNANPPTQQDVNKANAIANDLVNDFNQALSWGYNNKDQIINKDLAISNDKLTNAEMAVLAMQVASMPTSGGTAEFSKIRVVPKNGNTPLRYYVTIKDTDDKLIYGQSKGYTGGGGADYSKNGKILTWPMLAMEAVANWANSGVTYDTEATVQKPDILTQALTGFFSIVLNSLRNLLGVPDFNDLIFNTGRFGENSYFYGIAPVSWFNAVSAAGLIFGALAYGVLAFSLAKDLYKWEYQTLTVAQKMTVMEDMKQGAQAIGLIVIYQAIFQILAAINFNIVKGFAAMAGSLQSWQALTQPAGNVFLIGGVIVAAVYFVLSIYYFYFYTMRALVILALHMTAPLFISALALGDNYQPTFVNWFKELIVNIFEQSFQAIILYFAVSIVSIGGANLLTTIILIIVIIPLTKLFRRLFQVNGTQAGELTSGLMSGMGMAMGAASLMFNRGGGGSSRPTGGAGGTTKPDATQTPGFAGGLKNFLNNPRNGMRNLKNSIQDNGTLNGIKQGIADAKADTMRAGGGTAMMAGKLAKNGANGLRKRMPNIMRKTAGTAMKTGWNIGKAGLATGAVIGGMATGSPTIALGGVRLASALSSGRKRGKAGFGSTGSFGTGINNKGNAQNAMQKQPNRQLSSYDPKTGKAIPLDPKKQAQFEKTAELAHDTVANGKPFVNEAMQEVADGQQNPTLGAAITNDMSYNDGTESTLGNANVNAQAIDNDTGDTIDSFNANSLHEQAGIESLAYNPKADETVATMAATPTGKFERHDLRNSTYGQQMQEVTGAFTKAQNYATSKGMETPFNENGQLRREVASGIGAAASRNIRNAQATGINNITHNAAGNPEIHFNNQKMGINGISREAGNSQVSISRTMNSKISAGSNANNNFVKQALNQTTMPNSLQQKHENNITDITGSRGFSSIDNNSSFDSTKTYASSKIESQPIAQNSSNPAQTNNTQSHENNIPISSNSNQTNSAINNVQTQARKENKVQATSNLANNNPHEQVTKSAFGNSGFMNDEALGTPTVPDAETLMQQEIPNDPTMEAQKQTAGLNSDVTEDNMNNQMMQNSFEQTNSDTKNISSDQKSSFESHAKFDK